MFFNRKVKATRSTVLIATAAITIVQAKFFFLYGKIMLFLRYIGSSFLRVFSKMQQNFVTLIYKLEQKSSLRTKEIPFPRS
jgi:hypothetical protein